MHDVRGLEFAGADHRATDDHRNRAGARVHREHMLQTQREQTRQWRDASARSGTRPSATEVVAVPRVEHLVVEK